MTNQPGNLAIRIIIQGDLSAHAISIRDLAPGPISGFASCSHSIPFDATGFILVNYPDPKILLT